MKRIDQILHEMNLQIEESYNLKGAVLKITMTHEAFDTMVLEMAKNNKYSAYYTPSYMNDFVICGVRIEARSKKDVK